MARIYYQDEWVTLWHGDCRDVLSGMVDGEVAAVLTDPPYTERTHAKARKNSRNGVAEGVTEFAAISDDDLTSVLTECGRVSRGWVVATLDYRHAVKFDETPPPGLRSLRIGVWVKLNPTPQITGDRPAQGWEAISYLHRVGARPKWNGGGKHGNYVLRIADPEGHPTAKPLPMIADWVRNFTKPGDLILDPFAGSGPVGRAAKDAGRRAILVEARADYCEVIARRLAQDVLDFGALA